MGLSAAMSYPAHAAAAAASSTAPYMDAAAASTFSSSAAVAAAAAAQVIKTRRFPGKSILNPPFFTYFSEKSIFKE